MANLKSILLTLFLAILSISCALAQNNGAPGNGQGNGGPGNGGQGPPPPPPPPPGKGQVRPGGGLPDGSPNTKKRSPQFKVENDRVSVMLAQPGNRFNAMRFDFTTRGFPRARADYVTKSSNVGGAEGRVEGSQFSFRVGLFKIAEFVDTQYESFNNNTATILRELKLTGRSSWSPMQQRTTTLGGATKYSFNTSLVDGSNPSSDTVVNLVASVADTYFPSSAYNLSASSFKLDLKIDNWPFAQSDSKLAVFAVVGFKEQVRGDGAPRNRTAVNLGSFGSLNWVPTALGNNSQSIPVFSSDVVPPSAGELNDLNASGDQDRRDGERLQRVVFIFNTTGKFRSIYWDPSLDLADEALSTQYPGDILSSGSASVTLSSFLVLLMAFLSVFLL